MAGSIPDFDHGLGEDLDALRDAVRVFTAKEIAPRAAEIDRGDIFPRDLWPRLGELGVLGVTADEAWGGAGLGYLAHCVVMEEISRGSASVGLSYGAHSNLCVNQINRWGTEAQREAYLPKLISGEYLGALAMSEPGAGSDVMSLRLRARDEGDHYVLDGTKYLSGAEHSVDAPIDKIPAYQRGGSIVPRQLRARPLAPPPAASPRAAAPTRAAAL